jgi:hypothetical protein
VIEEEALTEVISWVLILKAKVLTKDEEGITELVLTKEELVPNWREVVSATDSKLVISTDLIQVAKGVPEWEPREATKSKKRVTQEQEDLI